MQTKKRGCKNPACLEPKIIDGICNNCGHIADDSNIVSEIQFGESSSGAAVVQGSFLGADQGAARSMGPAFARAGGGENREATIKEGRSQISGMASQFRITTQTANVAVQIFKVAATMNFIQGRRMDMVCAVCLYTACRKSQSCAHMLIDFADRVGVNVFKLGVTYRALHKAIPGSGDGIMPLLAEDLMWRFTSRLEFGELNDKVAEDAIRMARRMTKDWMVMGRRPAGVAGACIILAARMNNFRRTITEVVYVVKVTVQTVQKRLEEFKETDSSELSVAEFLSNQFLEKAHDPPSFYQQQPEFQAKKKKRKRRDMGNYGWNSDEEYSGDEEGEGSDKRQRTQESSLNPLRKDADGFSIPPLPTPAPTQQGSLTPAPMPQGQSSAPVASMSTPTPTPDPEGDDLIDPELMDARVQKEMGTTFRELVKEFGDQLSASSDGGDDEEEEVGSTTGAPKRRGRRPAQEVHVSPEWERSELEMETEISELISDPNTIQHAANYAVAQKRAAAQVLVQAIENPGKQVSMDTLVGEDEFADDPEVQNCLLSEADSLAKEKVWTNENKSWLRIQQKKQWDAKQAENRPPKARRNRKPKAQMGTGQKSPAASPAEAAITVLKDRNFSKKINYQSINDVFKNIDFRNKALGSAATSRASSDFGESESESTSRAGSEAPSEHSFLIQRKPRGKAAREAATARVVPTPAPEIVVEDEDEEGDEDDYVNPDAPDSPNARRREEETDNWRAELGEQAEEDVDDFDDAGMGDIDDDEGAFEERDFAEEDERGYGIDDDEF